MKIRHHSPHTCENSYYPKDKEQVLESKRKEGNPFIPLVGMQTSAAIKGKQYVEFSISKEKFHTTQLFYFWAFAPKTQKLVFHRDSCTFMLHSNIYNS